MWGSGPWVRKTPGGGNGNGLQYFSLKIPCGTGGAYRVRSTGVEKNRHDQACTRVIY